MDEEILRKILIARAKAQNKKPFTVSVTGSSMEPILYEGDHVTVLPQVAYEVGDILSTIINRRDCWSIAS